MPPTLTIRPGHPDFVDLPWNTSLVDWRVANLVDLPKGISRHEVRFLSYPAGIYVVKELQRRPARNDYAVLRALETAGAPAVRAVGLVESRTRDPADERSAALITAYEPFSFSYREILIGPGFGARRSQMLDAFAGLLVRLHLVSCYWGDCNLSNVLYRFDAEAIDTIMVDAETAEIVPGPLTDGRRTEDLEIMIENVAGDMADLAVAAGGDLDVADLQLGEDIVVRYRELWSILEEEPVIPREESYRIRERLEQLNDLGFDVDDVIIEPGPEGNLVKIRTIVGGRTFHSDRLAELTGIVASENQARIILSDLLLSEGRSSIDPAELDFNVPIERGEVIGLDGEGPPLNGGFKRYRLTESGISPRALPGTPGHVHVVATDEHDEDGVLISDEFTDPHKRRAIHEKRMRKMDGVLPLLPPPELHGPADARVTLVGWGSTEGVIREAMQQLADAGIAASNLQIRWLVPLHGEAIVALLGTGRTVIIVENNYSGQFARYLRAETGVVADGHIRKYDGEPFMPHHIVDGVRAILAGSTKVYVPAHEIQV